MSELTVPIQAIRALVAATEPKTEAGPLGVVRAIAGPVVAAELRRVADEHFWWPDADILRNRADELDPEGKA